MLGSSGLTIVLQEPNYSVDSSIPSVVKLVEDISDGFKRILVERRSGELDGSEEIPERVSILFSNTISSFSSGTMSVESNGGGWPSDTALRWST